jgi:hypothetical protein
MPYLFTCPHCQTKTQVEDRYSGQSGECVTCGEPIQLPHFATLTADAEPASGFGIDNKPLGWAITAGVLLVIMGCLVFAALQYGSQTVTQLAANRQRNTSMRNLEKIAAALNAYAADHGRYPPPVLYGPGKVKLHSWRVLILPYLDEEELFDQFDLNKPWDDQSNIQLAYQMPSAYGHPNAPTTGWYSASAYYLIVGQGTLFPNKAPLSPDQITDDPSQTILVIEATPNTTMGCWTEPVDLEYGLMRGQVNGTTGIEPGGLSDGGAAMVTVDERGHFLPETTSPNIFNALVTPNGGEPLPDDTLD